METIGSFQAKTQFAELLDRVEHGEEVTISRRGKPVARLVPIGEDKQQRQRKAVQAILDLGEKIAKSTRHLPPLTHKEMMEIIHSGRKY